ncbi:MAG: hypothetical protein CME17_01115 [Gemmatimonadetes bacterium]|nr:hypothetical protein [Gemmatimonadota bacterium]
MAITLIDFVRFVDGSVRFGALHYSIVNKGTNKPGTWGSIWKTGMSKLDVAAALGITPGDGYVSPADLDLILNTLTLKQALDEIARASSTGKFIIRKRAEWPKSPVSARNHRARVRCNLLG